MTQQTRTIAESNNFIVLDKYVTEWEVSDRYQSESELERELIQDLRNQVYEFVPDLTSQSAMLANVRVQLQALNQVSRQTDLLVSAASEASARLQKQSDLLLQAVSRFRLSA